MIRGTCHTFIAVLLASVIGLALAAPAPAAGPSKWILSWHVGQNVNKTLTEQGAPREERNECTVASNDECEVGAEGPGPREFNHSESVAVSALTGDVYVADEANHRVQVLDPEGQFVAMFGWNVNKTETGSVVATQAQKNICTAESHDECGPGERGTNGEPTGSTEQMWAPANVAIDPTNGLIYVFDEGYDRVDEYNATNEFILTFGGGVNAKGGNVCKVSEECQPGKSGAALGEFSSKASGGNRITLGPDGLVYIGDVGRVEKFNEQGAQEGEVSIKELSSTGFVSNVAVNNSGNLFITYQNSGGELAPGVHEFSSNGILESCVIDGQGKDIPLVQGIAFDAYGRLGIVGYNFHFSSAHAAIYQAEGPECGQTVGGAIVPPSGEVGKGIYQNKIVAASPNGIAFDLHKKSGGLVGEDQLYIADSGALSEIEGYRAVLFPEIKTCSTVIVSFTSADLCGEINPLGIQARGFFKYGTAPNKLEHETGTGFTGNGEGFVAFGYELTELVPNQEYWDETWVEAEAEGKETTAGAPPPVSFHTKTPAPEISEPPEALFEHETAAVLKASLNPEHAPTRYHFEYAACASEVQSFSECSTAQSTSDLESALYGTVGVTQEITGLAPNTPYAFRLAADNRFELKGEQEGGVAEGPEGHFTTRPLAVATATTGSATSVTATTAIISGSVLPDGQPATYAFELGVYDGPSTQFGVVFSGTAGKAMTPVQEQLALAGLQPGTTYVFRIRVQNGYSQATGAPAIFATSGLPVLLPAPGAPVELSTPQIAIPKESENPKKSLSRAQKLALALKACGRKPKNERARCKKNAHKKYDKKSHKSNVRGKQKK
jgi:DNA-binding beta-propeller fold protein YncE